MNTRRCTVLKMNIGFFEFNNQEERIEKQELFDEVENLDKVYATNGDSFEEFLATVVSEDDTIYISNMSDLGSNPKHLIRALRYFEENESVKVVVLEGLVNEPLLGLTKGGASKIVKTFTKMLTTGQIS